MNKAIYKHVAAQLGLGVAAFGLAAAVSPAAHAGNIILTGHDNDYHCHGGYLGGSPSGSAGPCSVLGAEATFVMNGSSLPVLAIDNGTELTSALKYDGIAYTAVTVNSVTAGMFNHSTYSAFVVASVTTCGGCDNPYGTGSKLAGFSTNIASFFDAGGGILGLTGATDPNAFAYAPDAATGSAIYSSSGFVATAASSAIPGFYAVNGDQTHNTFSTYSPAYTVAETFGVGGPAVTLFASDATIHCTTGAPGCTITKGGSVPEPGSLALLGVGLFGLGLARRRAARQGR